MESNLWFDAATEALLLFKALNFCACPTEAGNPVHACHVNLEQHWRLVKRSRRGRPCRSRSSPVLARTGLGKILLDDVFHCPTWHTRQ